MSYNENTRMIHRDITARLAPRGEPFTQTPSFGEAFRLGREDTRALELPNSERRMRQRFFGDQIEELVNMAETGKIDREDIAVFSKSPGLSINLRELPYSSSAWEMIDVPKMTEHLNAKYGTAFDFSDEAEREIMRGEHEERMRLLETTGFTGGLAAWLGSAYSYIRDDPAYAALLLVPGTEVAVASTALRSIGLTAAKDAGLNLAIEGANQYQIARFKNYLEIEYGMTDILANMTVAAVIGGAVGAGRGAWAERTFGDNVTIGEYVDALDFAIERNERLRTHPGRVFIEDEIEDNIEGMQAFRDLFATQPRDRNMNTAVNYLHKERFLNNAASRVVNRAPRWGSVAVDPERGKTSTFVQTVDDAAPVMVMDENNDIQFIPFKQARNEIDTEADKEIAQIDAFTACMLD